MAMIQKKKFYNIKCDCCGQMIDEQFWNEPEAVECMLDECNWKATEDGKHYCDDCWEYDDDDNIITKDGHKYTEDGEEIKA